MKQADITGIIRKGIVYLQSAQQEDGSFLSYSSVNQGLFVPEYTYTTTFTTSIILSALSGHGKKDIFTVTKQRAANFLLSQKSSSWSWNYWKRGTEEAKAMPYPDDLDDTFCAITALFHTIPDYIDGTVLAYIVHLLTATESQEGGPYYTWLVKENAAQWRDIDLAVNANIAYFLSLNGITLPNMNAFIELHIQNKDFMSPYYPSIYPVIYFISRFYQGKYCRNLQKFILSNRKNNHWGNPLQTALAAISLLNLGSSPELCKESINYVIEKQEDGIWKPYGFCFDPEREGKKYMNGSSALTTAFCLKLLMQCIKNKEIASREQTISYEEKLYRHIVQGVKERFATFDTNFKTPVLALLDKLLEKDTTKQITLFPYYFTLTLGDRKKDISKELLIQLGMANVLGWIGYTIYDDFLDEEGNPAMLSSANVCLRELTKIFEQLLPDNPAFHSFFHFIMDQLDAANTWEVVTCRIPVLKGKLLADTFTLPEYGMYEKLAEKSLGYGLGIFAILFALGYTQDSLEMEQMLSFFKHYLIAKQLNDDAHDWKKDLSQGHITPVCSLLLARIRYTGTIVFSKRLPKLQKIFWETVVEQVCTAIFHHVSQGRAALQQCRILVDSTPLENLLSKYEQAAQITLQERKKAIQFLATYK